MIGLPDGVLYLRPYTTEWQRLFQEEQARLRACIGEHVLDIQHIGSTSIPGMTAKPIIDISIAVANFEAAAICIAPLERLGYTYFGENGIPRRHYFVRENPRTHQVHMVERESEDWASTTHFRDYLIQHPDLARAYADLKCELARRFPTDREAYQDGKDRFIKDVVRMALSTAS